MTATSLRKVVFLDTNVLHFVSLYLSRAKEHNLFPFGDDPAAAEDHLRLMPETDLAGSLGRGLRAVMSLRHDSPLVEYSTGSELELLVGRARGKAIEKAAAEGIPDRMWTRLREKDIDKRLLPDDRTQIAGGVDGLGGMLQAAGIEATVSSPARGRDVLAIAKEVMGLVYLSVIDSVIYADAIAAQAHQIISEDRYFRKTVQRVKRDPSLGPHLQERTAVLLSRDPESVILPDAESVPRSGKGY